MHWLVELYQPFKKLKKTPEGPSTKCTADTLGPELFPLRRLGMHYVPVSLDPPGAPRKSGSEVPCTSCRVQRLCMSSCGLLPRGSELGMCHHGPWLCIKERSELDLTFVVLNMRNGT